MRRELDRDLLVRNLGKFLFDLGKMPMFRHAVRTDALVALGKEIISLDLAARAGHAAQTRDHDTAKIDRLLSHEREKRQQNACRVTARRRDQLRAANLVPINFRQSVDRSPEQFRCGMIGAVKFLIYMSVAEPKVGAQINDARAKIDKWFGDSSGDAVRQCEKNDVGLAGERLRINVDKLQRLRFFVMGESRKNLRDRFPGKLPRRYGDKIDIGMSEQQAHQFFPGIAGCADHRGFSLAAAENSRLCGFLHKAQWVFRLDAIATKTL